MALTNQMSLQSALEGIAGELDGKQPKVSGAYRVGHAAGSTGWVPFAEAIDFYKLATKYQIAAFSAHLTYFFTCPPDETLILAAGDTFKTGGTVASIAQIGSILVNKEKIVWSDVAGKMKVTIALASNLLTIDFYSQLTGEQRAYEGPVDGTGTIAPYTFTVPAGAGFSVINNDDAFSIQTKRPTVLTVAAVKAAVDFWAGMVYTHSAKILDLQALYQNNMSAVVSHTKEIKDLDFRMVSLENLGKPLGAWDSEADLPQDNSGLPDPSLVVQVGDYATVRNGPNGAPCRCIVQTVTDTGFAGVITYTWFRDIDYSTDVSGKIDALPSSVTGEIPVLTSAGQLQTSGKTVNDLGRVHTVNGIQPDAAKNVTLTAADINCDDGGSLQLFRDSVDAYILSSIAWSDTWY